MRLKGRDLRVGDVIRMTMEVELRVNAPRQGILTPVVPNDPSGFALEIDHHQEVVVLERYPENMGPAAGTVAGDEPRLRS